MCTTLILAIKLYGGFTAHAPSISLSYDAIVGMTNAATAWRWSINPAMNSVSRTFMPGTSGILASGDELDRFNET